MTVYAIHLADLQGKRFECLPFRCLLNGVLDDEPFDLDKRKFAGVAIRLNCEEERAEAICLIVRKHFKPDDMRMYRSKTGRGSWKAI